MNDLNAALRSTEAAQANATLEAAEVGVAALGESIAAAPVVGAATDLLAHSGSAENAPSTPSTDAADAPQVAGAGEIDAAPAAAAASHSSSTSDAGSSQEPLSSAAQGTASDGGDEGNAGAAAADGPSTDGAEHAAAASGSAGTSSTDANSLGERLLALPLRVAQHLESIYQIVTDHVRQTAAPADAAKSELAAEIDDLLHKISNGIAVSDGRIIAKLAALRSLL